jgi:hypothetical protein
MKKNIAHRLKSTFQRKHVLVFLVLLFGLFVIFYLFPDFFSGGVSYVRSDESGLVQKVSEKAKPIVKAVPPLDVALYDQKMLELANNPTPKPPVVKTVKDPKTGIESTITIEPEPVVNIWPADTVRPNGGALLPFNRIVAYYGNLYSKKMGVLGEYPEDEMLAKLGAEVKKWEVADPGTPVIPSLHYIAVVAQGSAGTDGKYRTRMPDKEIDKVLAMAEKINGIVFLDIQVGFSTVEDEVPRLEKYLKLPNVHLGLDPEFSMKTGIRPGKIVGTMDATDVNFAANYLAKLVKENNLTPKILMVHRYTQKMLTSYQNIEPLPEVQLIIDMDGWGGKAKKINTYKQFVYKEPVQFAGFKLFYKNDVLEPNTALFSPEELLKLQPRPSYIQFQ